jgi:hypothetical protein
MFERHRHENESLTRINHDSVDAPGALRPGIVIARRYEVLGTARDTIIVPPTTFSQSVGPKIHTEIFTREL